MMQPHLFEAALPVAREVAAATQGQRALAAFLSTQLETQQIQIFDERNEAHTVELPTSALRLLVDILSELADGNAVKVVPIHAELTTQEAADLINVSRRVRFSDLMTYKVAQEQASAAAMEELAAQAQALHMGYE
jgi:hypothetical protein